ncbi:hypothetical protein AB0P37_08425 [Streptomyces antimycoticus]|uniref:hypothetical protein n=1 Tax=Streptomyces antimycoticus TaxID=68175 RepID=UPI0034281F30
MSRIELGPETHAEEIADRIDVFRLANALVRETTWDSPPDVMDVLRVAEFLDGG